MESKSNILKSGNKFIFNGEKYIIEKIDFDFKKKQTNIYNKSIHVSFKKSQSYMICNFERNLISECIFHDYNGVFYKIDYKDFTLTYSNKNKNLITYYLGSSEEITLPLKDMPCTKRIQYVEVLEDGNINIKASVFFNKEGLIISIIYKNGKYQVDQLDVNEFIFKVSENKIFFVVLNEDKSIKIIKLKKKTKRKTKRKRKK